MVDVNVRVSSLTLYGALVSTQAPLPEIQLLLQQPGSTSALSTPGISTPQELSHNWRLPARRDGEASSPGGGVEGGPEGPCWLLQLCVSLVTQPREELYSDSDAGGSSGASLEPSPVRLEALQVSGLFVKMQPQHLRILKCLSLIVCMWFISGFGSSCKGLLLIGSDVSVGVGATRCSLSLRARSFCATSWR